MTECPIIEKDATNTFHKYKYTSEFAIKNTIHPLLVKYGVLFQLTTRTAVVNDYRNLKGELKLITHMPCGYTFYDIESGEKLEGNFVGTGEDSGDKGTYKAITGAIKYILTSTFLIPTGDDPEEANNTATPPAVATSRPAPTVRSPNLPGPACPVCQGAMWDNRKTKTNPKQPDYKCQRSKEGCTGVIWPPKPVDKPVELESMPPYPTADEAMDLPF